MGDDKMKKEISPQEVKKDPQWAERIEKILREWLLEQPYSTKLAFVLLNGYRLADDLTQAVFYEISDNYKAEVIHAAEELPGTLVNIEFLLTGVAADMLHSEDRMFETAGEDESEKEYTAKQASKSAEDDSEPNPSEKDNSNKSVNAEPTNELEKGKSR
ncbi:hypothetical protein ACFL5Z_09140 [Planctomycetota bacterium]